LKCVGNNTWEKDGIILPTTLERHSSRGEKYVTVLTLLDVNQEDTGIYICSGQGLRRKKFFSKKWTFYVLQTDVYVAGTL